MVILERGKETSGWAVIPLVVLLLVTGVLAGCGGSSEGDSRERLLAEGAAAKFARSLSQGVLILERQAQGVWTLGLTNQTCWNLDVENFKLDPDLPVSGSTGVYETDCPEKFAFVMTSFPTGQAAILADSTAKSQGTTITSLTLEGAGVYHATLADGHCWVIRVYPASSEGAYPERCPASEGE